ncbi:MAG: hypothetical protein QM753_10725 [Thermomicrobiales bacterium]
MSATAARIGQSIPAMPSARIADATTRLFWPGRFLLATSRRPGESCTDGDTASVA